MAEKGTSAVTLHIMTASAEEIEHSREELRRVCEQICCEAQGHPVKAALKIDLLNRNTSSR